MMVGLYFLRAFYDDYSDHLVLVDQNGQHAGTPAEVFYFSLALSLAVFNRMRDCNFIGMERETVSFLVLLLSFLMLLSD